MRAKGLMGLAAVTAIAVIAAVAVTSGGKPAVDPRVDAPVLPQLAPHLADAATLALTHGEAETTLIRKDKVWTVAERSGYPADPGKLRQTLLGLAELKLVEPKTAKPDLYARLEVEDAGKAGGTSTLVALKDAKGGSLGEVIIGKRRIDRLGGGTDGIYIRKPGETQSWLARGSVDLSGDTASWLDHKILDVDQAKVKQAVLTQPDGTKLTIGRDKPEDKLALVGAPADTKLKSDTSLVEPAGALAGLELTDVRAAADLAFPAQGLASAEYTTFDGLTIRVELQDHDGASWVRFKASGGGAAEAEAGTLNARLGPWVYAIAAYKANALKTKLADLVEAPKGS